MATSRRRERELARRRYERRRMREMERRAKQRRRNTILGASLGTAAVIAGIVLLAIHLAGGSDKSKKVDALTTPTPGASTSTSPPADPCAAAKPTAAQLHPTMPKAGRKAPKKLVVHDLKTGSGAAAKAGDTLCVTYVGADYQTGKVFDASYKHGGAPFAVTPLGNAPVIQGWNQGLVGVKPGGIRELIIPANLGYGATGQPPSIKPNETLLFVVSVTAVKPA